MLCLSNFEIKHSKVEGAYCLGVFQNGKDPTTLLGGKALNSSRSFKNICLTTPLHFLSVSFAPAWLILHFAVGSLGQITVRRLSIVCF